MLTAGVDPVRLFSGETPDGNLWLWAVRYHVWAHALQEQCGLWMRWVACVAYRARAALPQRARAEEVRGLWTLTIWPLRGLVSSLGVFVSGKQSGLNLVGVGRWRGCKQGFYDTTPAFTQVPLCSLKGVISPFNASLCRGNERLCCSDTSLIFRQSETKNNFVGVWIFWRVRLAEGRKRGFVWTSYVWYNNVIGTVI